jgi:UDP-N-acetylglucosamine 2-epimerase (non-hydrolysing)
MKLLSVVGARPNFMKIAPFVRAMRGKPVEHLLVHTGQHYAPDMSDVFFDELGIPQPTVNLEVGSGSHAYQLGQTMITFEPVLLEAKPDWVIVVGDVNATAACSITARKHGIAVAHIEAGLRSRDWTMPEEINRVVTDRLSNLLFTTDHLADENLRREGVDEKSICRVGNIMIDTLEFERDRAAALDPQRILAANAIASPEKIPALTPDRYAIVTLHRPSNVDATARLAPLVELLAEISRSLTVIFAVHPRTRARLTEFGLWDPLCNYPNVCLTTPLSYREMLRLNMDARLALTDSGGIQEECTVLGTHCLTLRANTERPITLADHGGTNHLVGAQPEQIRNMFQTVRNMPRRPSRPPLWDGHTAERILTRLLPH